MNISDYSPVVDGLTFISYLVDWVENRMMASGIWDGVFFDNLFGRINPHIPNSNDPSLLDYDLNLNGVRDETPAQVSEVTRRAMVEMLNQIRASVGDLEIIAGNTGPYPNTALAPYVNGYIFECIQGPWFSFHGLPSPSEANWRRSLDDYLTMQRLVRTPQVNIIQGCGKEPGEPTYFDEARPGGFSGEPTTKDIKEHRLILGTALLGDGFYEYDVVDARSAPTWFDEFSVDPDGVAIEDRRFKGYLGQALTEAVELASPGKVIWQEDFEGASTLPVQLNVDAGVSVTTDIEDVIAGSGSLVIDNPDHSKNVFVAVRTIASLVRMAPGKTHVFEFDWEILETIDGMISFEAAGSQGPVGVVHLSGIVAGDRGTAKYPVTLNPGADFTMALTLFLGGGRVAIDDIRISEGGAGPWRRDFENGFVLVNPINVPHIFDAGELAGELGRTGIKRILGTQAPQVNNGQPVSGTLTLEPFDAIILLADHIPVTR
ncbi:MAG: hypothetical protein IH873_06670 [Chloroflexi bacterium]|nr:hypothetical protein [Chloroflexota bacterium]